jgi:hypothetical protein
VATYYGVTAYYPSQVKSDFGTHVNFTETIIANHVNALQAEMTAVETTLGSAITTSSGWIGSFDQTTTTWNTLKDRIANIEYGINNALTAVPQGGTSGQVLTKNSGNDYDASWKTFNALPSFVDNAGKYLTNDGTSASWAAVEASISPILLIGA